MAYTFPRLWKPSGAFYKQVFTLCFCLWWTFTALAEGFSLPVQKQVHRHLYQIKGSTGVGQTALCGDTEEALTSICQGLYESPDDVPGIPNSGREKDTTQSYPDDDLSRSTPAGLNGSLPTTISLFCPVLLDI